MVREPVAYNLIYTDALHRVAPRAGETLRLQTRAGAAPQSFAVAPAAPGALQGRRRARTSRCSRRASSRRWSAQYPGFLWRGDGRVNINQQPGYQIVFQATHRRAHDLRQARPARARTRPAADAQGSTSRCSPRARPPIPRADAVGRQRRAQDAVPLAALRHEQAVGRRERRSRLGRVHARSTCASGASSRSRTSPRRAGRRGSCASTSARRSACGARRRRSPTTSATRSSGASSIAVVNFPPKQIGPVRSECLVLGTYTADGTVLLLAPEPEAALGDRVG